MDLALHGDCKVTVPDDVDLPDANSPIAERQHGLQVRFFRLDVARAWNLLRMVAMMRDSPVQATALHLARAAHDDTKREVTHTQLLSDGERQDIMDSLAAIHAGIEGLTAEMDRRRRR